MASFDVYCENCSDFLGAQFGGHHEGLEVEPCATCIEDRYNDGYSAGYSAGLIKGFETPPLDPGNADSNVNTIGCEICRGNPNVSFICPRCGQ